MGDGVEYGGAEPNGATSQSKHNPPAAKGRKLRFSGQDYFAGSLTVTDAERCRQS